MAWYNRAKEVRPMLEIDEQAQTVRGVRLATFRRCYSAILAGEAPWLGLGNMMHQWFGRYDAYRAELVREAIDVSENATPEQWRWAVWMAASVEYLCKRAGLDVPAWALEDRFRLEEAWYYAEVEGPEEEAELREETPVGLALRGIYCEASPYRDK